jgi:hypothetical protein
MEKLIGFKRIIRNGLIALGLCFSVPAVGVIIQNVYIPMSWWISVIGFIATSIVWYFGYYKFIPAIKKKMEERKVKQSVAIKTAMDELLVAVDGLHNYASRINGPDFEVGVSGTICMPPEEYKSITENLVSKKEKKRHKLMELESTGPVEINYYLK